MPSLLCIKFLVELFQMLISGCYDWSFLNFIERLDSIYCSWIYFCMCKDYEYCRCLLLFDACCETIPKNADYRAAKWGKGRKFHEPPLAVVLVGDQQAIYGPCSVVREYAHLTNALIADWNCYGKPFSLTRKLMLVFFLFSFFYTQCPFSFYYITKEKIFKLRFMIRIKYCFPGSRA